MIAIEKNGQSKKVTQKLKKNPKSIFMFNLGNKIWTSSWSREITKREVNLYPNSKFINTSSRFKSIMSNLIVVAKERNLIPIFEWERSANISGFYNKLNKWIV